MSLPQELKTLLESGVHFGHQAKRWNPKMGRFVFGKRSGILVIDLEKTLSSIKDVQNVVSGIAAKGGKVLFVGTKRQAQGIVKEVAENANMPYVVERWVGGMLTNFDNIRNQVKKYCAMADQKENDAFESYTKKEVVVFTKQLEKMRKKYEGIKDLVDLPDAVFIVDPKKESLAVKEATRMGIPIISLIDTDGNPELVDYPIPGNDDALKSIRAVMGFISEALANTGKIAPVAAEEEKTEEVIEESKEETVEETAAE